MKTPMTDDYKTYQKKSGHELVSLISMAVILGFYVSTVSGSARFVFTSGSYLNEISVFFHYTLFMVYTLITILCVGFYADRIYGGYETENGVRSGLDRFRAGNAHSSINSLSFALSVYFNCPLPPKDRVLRICLETSAIGLMFLIRELFEMHHLQLINPWVLAPGILFFALIVLLLELPFVWMEKECRAGKLYENRMKCNYAKLDF